MSLIPKGGIRGLLVIKMTFGQKEVSGLLITIISLPLLKHVVISILQDLCILFMVFKEQ